MASQITNYKCPACSGPRRFAGVSGKLLTILLALALILALTVPAWAEQQPDGAFVYDTAGILSADDDLYLEQLAEDQVPGDYYSYYGDDGSADTGVAYAGPSYLGLLIMSIVYFALLILMIVAMGILFTKAGKPGWAAVVPFYDQYTLYEITWGNGWRFLMLLIPIYNIVLAIMTCIRLAKAFGKSGGYAVGLVFLPHVFVSMLAFGSAAYYGVPGRQQPGYQPPQPGYQPPQPTYQPPRQPVQPQQPRNSGFQPAFCPNCGARVEGGGKFCQNCGRPL